MRILIVEDDEPLTDALAGRIRSRIAASEIAFARSHDEAIEAIGRQVVDAAVIDLRLPSQLDAADASVDFGLAVEANLATKQPGALRVFLTASDAKVVIQQVRMGEVDDFFSNNDPFGIVDYVQKEGADSLDECVERLVQHDRRLAALDAIELEGSDGFDLDSRRAVAITVRIAGGTRGRVLRQQGFSRCVTALVECVDSDGRSLGNAFCKSGPSSEIDREYAGYKQAEFRLPSTVCPKLARVLSVGTGGSKALVFTKAPTSRTFFDLVGTDPARAAMLVGRLPAALDAWSASATEQSFDLGEHLAASVTEPVRTRFGVELADLSLAEFFGTSVDLIARCQHGDLHGANLFVTDSHEPFLIDFAHTASQVGPVDQVSLELSLIFHPDSPHRSLVTEADCERWLQDDHPLSIDSIGPVVAACREWTRTDGHSDKSHAAGVLVYALWILNHADEPALALALARSARRILAA